MKVNSIDNTNFRALKINKNLQSEIVKKGGDFVTELNNYGKSIADVVRYNVVFDESIKHPKIYSFDKSVTRDFFAELKNEEQSLGKFYEVPAGFDGDTRGGFYPNQPRLFMELYEKEAGLKYKEFKKLNIYEQAAKYSRLLEELDIKRMVAEEKEKAAKLVDEIIQKSRQQKLVRAVDDLIDRYGEEFPAANNIEEQKALSKKSWWQKIFS